MIEAKTQSPAVMGAHGKRLAVQSSTDDLAGVSACRLSSWIRHFVHPAGWPEFFAGRLMATQNASVNRFVFEMLDAWPHERVLEIGFGPGRLLGWLAERTTHGRVAGVDPSKTMVKNAQRRLGGRLQVGRIEVHEATASSLPFDDGAFDKVCAVNCFQFWNDPCADLLEVRRVLRPEGTLLLGLRTRDDGSDSLKPAFSADEVCRVEALLRNAEFRNVRRHKRGHTTCVLATR